jgi:hypothetical protein
MGKTGSFSEKRVLPLKTAKNGFARRKPVKSAGESAGAMIEKFLSP